MLIHDAYATRLSLKYKVGRIRKIPEFNSGAFRNELIKQSFAGLIAEHGVANVSGEEEVVERQALDTLTPIEDCSDLTR